MDPQQIGVWLLGRTLFALIIFRIFSYELLFSPATSPLIRILLVAAVPGSMELLAIAGYLIGQMESGM